jgi:hypothetical protein
MVFSFVQYLMDFYLLGLIQRLSVASQLSVPVLLSAGG